MVQTEIANRILADKKIATVTHRMNLHAIKNAKIRNCITVEMVILKETDQGWTVRMYFTVRGKQFHCFDDSLCHARCILLQFEPNLTLCVCLEEGLGLVTKGRRLINRPKAASICTGVFQTNSQIQLLLSVYFGALLVFCPRKLQSGRNFMISREKMKIECLFLLH